MQLTPHPETEQLRQALLRSQRFTIPWEGVVYRSASVQYANRDELLTGAGSKTAGARWNPPESVATLYTALEMQTALEESLTHNRYYGVPVDNALPRVLVCIRAVLKRVLNLTGKEVRRCLGVTREQLLREDWRAANDRREEALTQAIGGLAWDAEWEGILVPSVADPGGVGLVIFPGNLMSPDSFLMIVNRDQLPRRG